MNQLISDTLALMSIFERTVEEGDCILWTGATGSTGHPIFKVPGVGCRLVRREVFRMCCGDLAQRQPIDTRCSVRACINPAHLHPSTISNIARKAAKRGAWRGLARRVKISTAKRAKGKLTIEQAREIRTSTETGPVLSARYGVNRSLIAGIKAGKAWKDYANPYLSLIGGAA